MPPTTEFQKNDIVDLGHCQMIIVGVKPNRPSNPYIGIKVNGKGAPYKVGYRYGLVKIGTADQNHPALVAYRARTTGPDDEMRRIITLLVDSALRDDHLGAKVHATKVKILMGL